MVFVARFDEKFNVAGSFFRVNEVLDGFHDSLANALSFI
jgi:hypothetical protein